MHLLVQVCLTNTLTLFTPAPEVCDLKGIPKFQNRNTSEERARGFDSLELLNNHRDKWLQSPQFIVINFLCAGGLS